MNHPLISKISFGLFLVGGLAACGGGGGGGEVPVVNPPPATSNLALLANQTVSACFDTNAGKTSNVAPQTIIARGGDPFGSYNWASSTFPSGTTIDALTGVFKSTGGTFNLRKGSYPFGVTVSDRSSTATGTVTLNVTEANSGVVGGVPGVGCPTAVFQQDSSGSFSNLPDSNAGKPYGANLFVMGGTPPYTSWTVATGSPPPGLVLEASNGVVRSTPFASASGSTYTFTVNVKDSTGATAIGGAAYKIKAN